MLGKLRTSDVEAFEGQVVFHVLTYETVRAEIVLDDILRAYPDLTGKANAELTRMDAFVIAFSFLYGNTFGITFNLRDDAPDALHNFREWWQTVGATGVDTVGALKGWLQIYAGDVARAWDEAIARSREVVPTASEELRPGAEKRADADPNFVKDGSASSALSSPKSDVKSTRMSKGKLRSMRSEKRDVTKAKNA